MKKKQLKTFSLPEMKLRYKIFIQDNVIRIYFLAVIKFNYDKEDTMKF